MQFLWSWKQYDEIYEGEARKLPSEKIEKFSPNLKEVEFIGFLGCPSELTVSMFIIDHVEGLEELMVVASDESYSIREVALARAHRHFHQITPPSVDLQII